MSLHPAHLVLPPLPWSRRAHSPRALGQDGAGHRRGHATQGTMGLQAGLDPRGPGPFLPLEEGLPSPGGQPGRDEGRFLSPRPPLTKAHWVGGAQGPWYPPRPSEGGLVTCPGGKDKGLCSRSKWSGHHSAAHSGPPGEDRSE